MALGRGCQLAQDSGESPLTSRALRRAPKLARLCSPKVIQQPAAGGDDNALPCCGSAARRAEVGCGRSPNAAAVS